MASPFDVSNDLDSTHSTAPVEPPPPYNVSIGVQALVDATLEAFVLLEPWCFEPEPDTPRIMCKIMAHLKTQALRYFKAIDKSIECSDKGLVFSMHALDLCHGLEEKMSATEILKFIKRMKDEVSSARKDAQATRARFVDVKEQLTKEKEHIPSSKETLMRDGRGAWRAGERWSIAEIWATWVIKHSGLEEVTKSVGIGAAMSKLPHVGIILPVAFPVALLATGIVAKGVKELAALAIKNRIKRVVSCHDALDGLKDIEEKIGSVINSVDQFAGWWSQMGSDLEEIERQVRSQSNHDELVARIRQQLVCLEGPFAAYSSQIRNLQDFYPPP
ncbi:hypothetical protein C8R45DRAFT_973899 [Mycena sanguinolenta]|nr:hypothetical protein C8R45DRAFT_973899 [Mycena sanguinolenta]